MTLLHTEQNTEERPLIHPPTHPHRQTNFELVAQDGTSLELALFVEVLDLQTNTHTHTRPSPSLTLPPTHTHHLSSVPSLAREGS